MVRCSGRNSDPVLVAAAGIGGCAERCAVDRRDTEDTVLAEIAELVAALPAVKRQQALDQAAARCVDSTDHGHTRLRRPA